MSERLSQILVFLEETPNDPFLLYAAALEYQKAGQTERTQFFFDKLLTEQADYLPTYYHAAAFFAETGEIGKAKVIYEKGIALAEKQNEKTALREIKNAYLNFTEEYEI